jgi:hypothetical protein
MWVRRGLTREGGGACGRQRLPTVAGTGSTRQEWARLSALPAHAGPACRGPLRLAVLCRQTHGRMRAVQVRVQIRRAQSLGRPRPRTEA